MSILIDSRQNSVISEWGYTLEVDSDGVIVSITRDLTHRKHLIDELVALINHPLYPNGTRGSIKTILKPSMNDGKEEILLIKFQTGVCVRAGFDQITNN